MFDLVSALDKEYKTAYVGPATLSPGLAFFKPYMKSSTYNMDDCFGLADMFSCTPFSRQERTLRQIWSRIDDLGYVIDEVQATMPLVGSWTKKAKLYVRFETRPPVCFRQIFVLMRAMGVDVRSALRVAEICHQQQLEHIAVSYEDNQAIDVEIYYCMPLDHSHLTCLSVEFDFRGGPEIWSQYPHCWKNKISVPSLSRVLRADVSLCDRFLKTIPICSGETFTVLKTSKGQKQRAVSIQVRMDGQTP